MFGGLLHQYAIDLGESYAILPLDLMQFFFSVRGSIAVSGVGSTSISRN
jgi:hypothetical protein